MHLFIENNIQRSLLLEDNYIVYDFKTLISKLSLGKDLVSTYY